MNDISKGLQIADHSSKATEQYFLELLFIILCKAFLTFQFADETLKYDRSNESYGALLSRGTGYYALQGGSNF